MDTSLSNYIKTDSPDFYFAILENSNSPTVIDVMYDSSNKRLKSVGTIQTVLEMNELAETTLSIIDSGLYFSPDFPEFLIPNTNTGYDPTINPEVVQKAITWGIVKKEPGTVGGGMFAGTKELKPRTREFIALINKANADNYISGFSTESLINNPEVQKTGGTSLFTKIDAQVFDNLVQYNIWSKSNYEVEKLTEWFETFMHDYTGMFREMGIVQLVYVGRTRDETLMIKSNGYHVRSVLYYVRTERVYLQQVLPIKRLNLSVSTSNLVSVLNRLENNISPLPYDSIMSKWINRNENLEVSLNG